MRETVQTCPTCGRQFMGTALPIHTCVVNCPVCGTEISPSKWHHCIGGLSSEAKVELGLWLFTHLGETSERMDRLREAVHTRQWGTVSLIIREEGIKP